VRSKRRFNRNNHKGKSDTVSTLLQLGKQRQQKEKRKRKSALVVGVRKKRIKRGRENFIWREE